MVTRDRLAIDSLTIEDFCGQHIDHRRLIPMSISDHDLPGDGLLVSWIAYFRQLRLDGSLDIPNDDQTIYSASEREEP